MNTYTAPGGVTYTDDDIERWAADAERGIYPGEPGEIIDGPMLNVVPLDDAHRAKAEELAEQRGLSVQELFYQFIDAA